MSPRRASPERQERIERIADELRAAIHREPLLRRLPSHRELAEIYHIVEREARAVLELLAEQGWAAASRSGYRAVRKRGAGPPQQVVFVQATQGAGQFMSFVARGADEQCRHHRLAMQGRWVDQASRDEQFGQLERELPGLHIGWLLYQKPSDQVLRRWSAVGRQFVLLDSLNRGLPAPTVILDHVGAARLATEHLLALGHRRIALVHAANSLAPVPEGVRQVFAQHALERSPEHDLALRVPSHWRRYDIDVQMHDWIARLRRLPADQRPTAAIAYNRRWATFLLSVCWKAAVSVPGELSIVAVGSKFGHLEEDEHITLASAGLAERMGAEAVDLLRKTDREDNAPVLVLNSSLELPDASAGPASI